MMLIGVPIDRDDNTTGLAAAKRTFLAAAPLFRTGQQTNSMSELWPRFWEADRPQGDDEGGEVLRPGSDALSVDQAEPPSVGSVPEGAGQVARPQRVAWPQQGDQDRHRLIALVRELAGFADDGRRPALINLLVDLRRHAATRRLPAPLVRLALPLALAETAILPKPAPGLLGGRRLPLGLSRASMTAKPLSDWLALGLGELSREADQSYRRLAELTSQHRAWHTHLATAGLRRHARAPGALDLLAATPILSIGLVAQHLGCSHVAAGRIIERLVDLGILNEQTSRSRHKVFIAGNLRAPSAGEAELDTPLAVSEPASRVDVDAIGATFDGLFADLDRLQERTQTTLSEAGR